MSNSGSPPVRRFRMINLTTWVIQDTEESQAKILGNNGWLRLCEVGSTEDRPNLTTPTNSVRQGNLFYDTTVGKLIFWTGSGDGGVGSHHSGNWVDIGGNVS